MGDAFVETLIRSIEADRFRSVSQLEIVEACMNAEQRERYLRVLIHKVADDHPHASVPMMRRILQLVAG